MNKYLRVNCPRCGSGIGMRCKSRYGVDMASGSKYTPTIPHRERRERVNEEKSCN